ncbi:MAG: DUF5711 family protein [Clostridia bacterium]
MQKEEGKRAKKVHSALNTVRTCIIALFVIVVVCALVFNAKSINMDNIRRLLAKIDYSMNSSAKGGTISFTANENNVILPFKGGIAVQATDGLTIFDKTGNEFSNFNITYKNPILKASEKYLLACDHDGKSLKVTNSFAVLFEKEFTFKIRNTAVSDSGSFAILQAADGYKSTVTVFSSNFKEEFSASFADRYVMDLALSSDGSTIAVCSLMPENGITNTVISLYKTNADKAFKEIKIEKTEVFKMEFVSSDNIVAISSDSTYFYNKQGEEQYKLNFDGNLLLSYDLTNPEYSTFITSSSVNDSAAKIYISDNRKTVMTADLEEVPMSIGELSSGVALLYHDRVTQIKYSKTKLLETEVQKMDKEISKILTSNNTVYLVEGNQITSIEVS